MRGPYTFKRLFLRSLLITFLVFQAGVSMAGKGEEATIPEPLQKVLESLDYEVVKCKPLEGGRFCHSSSIARSIQIYDREHNEHGDRSLMTGVMNSFSTRSSVVSRFRNIDPRSWDSPHTQAAAVSDLLARTLFFEFAAQRDRLVEGLERISNRGYHSILLTAINTLRAIRESAEPVDLPPTARELVTDVRRDLNHFGSLEVAILLAMTIGKSTLVLDGSDPSGISVVAIARLNPGENSTSMFEITIWQHRELPPQSLEALLDAASFRFVISREYGLLPLQRLDASVQEQPALVAGASISPASCSNNECLATCYGMRKSGSRSMGTSDDKPVKSRAIPKLKNSLPKESIKDKWDLYSNRFRQQTPDKPVSTTFKLNAVLAGAALAHSLYLWYHSDFSAVDGIRQCGQYYIQRAENAGRNFRVEVYNRICGNMTWYECRQYYMNNYIPDGR
ncbi:hypothetical protein NX722_02025 [Endozoicomonas gorgoniicola]|uniref:Uncharacterized protein n=1 Tax=Endozoicomonas gorgoniicola TaxID=1234144 RepID=A0ABT3MPY5_9GAMM|nr:hypothetical protein [Endozoicomonas gorgoniicola]MCW7551438.1 hypothetical protein [Endozoicomonas gorgoniicola]